MKLRASSVERLFSTFLKNFASDVALEIRIGMSRLLTIFRARSRGESLKKFFFLLLLLRPHVCQKARASSSSQRPSLWTSTLFFFYTRVEGRYVYTRRRTMNRRAALNDRPRLHRSKMTYARCARAGEKKYTSFRMTAAAAYSSILCFFFFESIVTKQKLAQLLTLTHADGKQMFHLYSWVLAKSARLSR